VYAHLTGLTLQTVQPVPPLKRRRGQGTSSLKREASADQLSSKADELRSDAKPWFEKEVQQMQSIVQTVGDAASQASESVTAYTKETPFKAILIAAASGAVLATLFHTISRLRD
jgi:ElaB/YqjD/DUF883 family membrane-anchored ribosome-binding protein